MTNYAKAFGLNNTNFTNCHGNDINNKSTAADIGRLSAIAMTDPLMRIVCSTLRHDCTGKDYQGNDKNWVFKTGN